MKKEMENGFRSSPSSFYDMISNSTGGALISSSFDYLPHEQLLMGERSGSSLGFMQLLGVNDYFTQNQLFDFPMTPNHQTIMKPEGHNSNYISEGLISSSNQPETPNASSISSASSDAANNEDRTQYKIATGQYGEVEEDIQHHDQNEEEEEEEEVQERTKKLVKAKTGNKKSTKQREARIAFMTKSEVDHLEDGYRWRKYGQKAVKNSSFPRSYYRCTSASCNVKKRVERSFSDPSVVVTTYEGQHTHPCPLISRPSNLAGDLLPPPLPQHHQLLNLHQHIPRDHFVSGSNHNSGGFGVNERRFCTPAGRASFLVDHGLLQDILPSHMLN